jgi:hypothetical protein
MKEPSRCRLIFCFGLVDRIKIRKLKLMTSGTLLHIGDICAMEVIEISFVYLQYRPTRGDLRVTMVEFS